MNRKYAFETSEHLEQLELGYNLDLDDDQVIILEEDFEPSDTLGDLAPFSDARSAITEDVADWTLEEFGTLPPEAQYELLGICGSPLECLNLEIQGFAGVDRGELVNYYLPETEEHDRVKSKLEDGNVVFE